MTGIGIGFGISRRSFIAKTVNPVGSFRGSATGTGNLMGNLSVLTASTMLNGSATGIGSTSGDLTVITASRMLSGNATGIGNTSGNMSVVAAATVFRDNFNRADEPLVSSPNWTNVSGNSNALSISNNQLATAASEGAYLSPDVIKSADHYVQHTAVNSNSVGPFIVARLTDQMNWGAGVRYNSGGLAQIWKRTDGTLTQYGSTSTNPAVNGATIRVETVGDMTQIVVNGAVVAGPYVMNGAGSGVTRQGYVSRTNANSPWADNYETGPLAALTT